MTSGESEGSVFVFENEGSRNPKVIDDEGPESLKHPGAPEGFENSEDTRTLEAKGS